MSSYAGRHARLYDLFYADKPYAEEAAFVDAVLCECGVSRGGRLLDVACGTGRHALEFEKLGYQVAGADHSTDMIAVARQRAAAASSAAPFHCQDMEALDVPGAPFDAVTCLFDSIGYLRTNEAIRRALEGIGRHLKPGGVLAFEFWHAAAMLRNHDPVRVRRYPLDGRDGGEILRIAETSLDCSRQTATVLYTVYEFSAEGRYRTFSETQTNRYFLVEEMKALLAAGGLEPGDCYPGFQRGRPITESDWHIVAVARKPQR